MLLVEAAIMPKNIENSRAESFSLCGLDVISFLQHFRISFAFSCLPKEVEG